MKTRQKESTLESERGVGGPRRLFLKPFQAWKHPYLIFFLSMLIYIGMSTSFASRKPLWLDERHGLQVTLGTPWSTLWLKGAATQGSPAPLFYLFCKAGRGIKEKADAWGVSPLVSWRWSSLLPFLAGALIFLSRKSRCLGSTQAQLLIVTLFLFSKTAFRFSYEARPYALWLVLSFLFLACIAEEEKPWYWTLICLMMGWTATASLFQFAAFLAVYAFLARRLKRSIWQHVQTIIPVVLASFIALYYAQYAGRWPYQGANWGTWKDFLIMVSHHLAPLTGAALLVMVSRHAGKAQASLLYMTTLMWYLMGPFIFAITRHQGFFFHSRQYIYWTASTVFILLGLVDLLAQEFPARRAHPVRVGWIALLVLLCFDRAGVYYPVLGFLKAHF